MYFVMELHMGDVSLSLEVRPRFNRRFSTPQTAAS